MVKGTSPLDISLLYLILPDDNMTKQSSDLNS
jgi:hypothetical protein